MGVPPGVLTNRKPAREASVKKQETQVKTANLQMRSWTLIILIRVKHSLYWLVNNVFRITVFDWVFFFSMILQWTCWLAFYTHSSRTAVRLYGDQALVLKRNPWIFMQCFCFLGNFCFPPILSPVANLLLTLAAFVYAYAHKYLDEIWKILYERTATMGK